MARGATKLTIENADDIATSDVKRNGGSCQRSKCQSEKLLLNSVNKHCLVVNSFSLNKSGRNVNLSMKNVHINGVKVDSVIDSCSDLNLVSSEMFFDLNITSYIKDSTIITGLSSIQVCTVGKCTALLQVDGHSYDLTFYIVPDDAITCKLILGQPLFDLATVVFDRGMIRVKPRLGGELASCESFVPKGEDTESDTKMHEEFEVPGTVCRSVQPSVSNPVNLYYY